MLATQGLCDAVFDVLAESGLLRKRRRCDAKSKLYSSQTAGQEDSKDSGDPLPSAAWTTTTDIGSSFPQGLLPGSTTPCANSL